MSTLLLVMVGSAAGAAARWWTDQVVSARLRAPLPVATILVNLVGSFVLGVLLGAASDRGVAPAALALLGTGLCGGFTTYSTFAFETVRLVEDGRTTVAATNVVASVVGGLLAAGAGWWLGALLPG